MAFPYGENTNYEQQPPTAGRRIAPHGEQRVQYGDTGTNQGTAMLPIIDTQRARRNFEGLEKNQWYSLEELQSGDIEGNTETDAHSEIEQDHRYKGKGGGGGYTEINKKVTPGGRPWKTSSPRAKRGTN